MFFICAHCDRGQRYCSNQCREQARPSANDGAPTAATNRAPKDGSIIAIDSAITGAAAGKRNRA